MTTIRTVNPLRLFAEVTLIMVVTEITLMQVLPSLFGDMSGWEATIADALAMALLAGPMILWRTLRAMRPDDEPDFSEREQPSHPWRWTLLVLIIGGSLTFWRASVLYDETHARAAQGFALKTERLEADVQLSFARIVQALRGTRGMIDAYPDVQRIAFERSIASRNLFAELSGLRGLGFIEAVPASELSALVTRERREGAPDFAVKGVGGAPIHASTPYIIRFVEPLAQNRAAVGLDIASEKNRKTAADLAARLGEPVLTGVITLAQDKQKRAGALLLLPTYRGGSVPADVDARLAQIRGWVYSPLVYEELLAGANNGAQGLIAFDIAVRDASNGKETSVFQTTATIPSAAARAKPRFSSTRTLNIGKQDFVFHVVSTPAFESGFDWNGPARLGIAGTLASILLALATWLLMTGRNRALEKANELTDAVRSAYLQMEHATKRVETVLEASPFGILIVDAQGHIVMCNPAADRMFGYDASELLTQSVNQLVPLTARQGHDARMASYHSNPSQRRMGGTRRLNALRKDGSEFPVEIGLNPLHVDKETSVLVTVIDISERALAEDELVRYRHQLEELVSERTADAVHAKDVAERANRAKTVFLTNMSHELRTPLHAVLSFANLGKKRAAETPDIPPKLVQYFEKIVDGGERLLSLLTALIDLSTLESGKRAFHFTPLAVHAVIREALKAVEPEAVPRSIHFVTELPATETIVWLDQEGMLSVLNKVLLNAIAFSPVGGEVTLTVTLGEHQGAVPNDASPALQIIVADRGIGIPENEFESIFDAFVQSSKTETGAGGKGLGLAICREIVSAHGGTIHAGANPGGGAVIRITLPLAQPLP